MNKKNMLLWLLVATMLAGSAVGCSNDTVEETDAVDTTVTETVAEPETTYLDSLTKVDFNGASFRSYGANTLNDMAYPTLIQLSTGELNGEGCNDAIYHRSVYLEEFYNVDFVETISEGNIDANKVIADISAGDASQDMYYADLASHGIKLVLAGTMYPSDMIPGLQLDRPYWSQEMQEALTIGDSFYFPTGSITPRYYGSAFMLMFNRDIITDMNLTDPQELALEGKWTIDAMFDIAADAYVDLNGSGKVDQGDQVGFGYGNTTQEALLLGCGYHCIQNKDGKMKLSFDDENLVTLMQWLVQQYQQEGIVYQRNTEIDFGAMVDAGQCLFDSPNTFDLVAYRELEYDFGLVPFPKKDEMQEEYISYAQPYIVSVPYVPVTNTGDSLSMTGTLMEAMAVYGYEKVQPIIYDQVIMVKNTRDEASAQIVDKLFENITVELATLINPAGVWDKVKANFTTSLGKTEITTVYAENRAAVENYFADLEATFAEFRSNLEAGQ